ncbi:MAG: Hsp20/alpha crystallin family protein [Deltaproteobacteria bacterium]|nr:Hsp20/alpha crystallin family protein [Deltaproteobacteria bacterium]
MMKDLNLWNEGSAPWRGLMDMQRHLDRILDESISGFPKCWLNEDAVFQPACDIEETDTHYLLSVDLPGVSKNDIQIEVKDNQVYISGERKSERKGSAISERYCGKFQRLLTIPAGVDADKIEAQYQDGVLTVALAKAESAKPRQIKISEGKGSFFGRLIGTKETDKDKKTAAANAA